MNYILGIRRMHLLVRLLEDQGEDNVDTTYYLVNGLKAATEYSFKVKAFDENGNEVERFELGPSTGNLMVQIPAGTWHTVEVKEPCVIFEHRYLLPKAYVKAFSF